ncbi:SDR family oxidoreductase [Streptomyces tauricus]
MRSEQRTLLQVSGVISCHHQNQNLAVTCRKQGIRTHAIAPAPPTGIRVNSAPAGIGPALIRVLIGVNSGCLGGADEQAAAITFLASDAASFVNGAVLPVDDSAAV